MNTVERLGVETYWSMDFDICRISGPSLPPTTLFSGSAHAGSDLRLGC